MSENKPIIKSKYEIKESYKFPDPKSVVKPVGAKITPKNNTNNNKK